MSLDKKHIIVGLGELLWDLLPSGKQLGGGPANFAYITNLLGNTGIPASRIGGDSLGHEALQRLTELGLSTAFVQSDPTHPTGTVKVKIDDSGQPDFAITESVAWDFMEWTPGWHELAETSDAICFGSLAQRSPQSRSTTRTFLQATRPDAIRVFDVNLRQDFYTAQVLKESMSFATIVKLNHQELPTVMELLGLENRTEQASAQRLLSSYDLKLICITRGSNGSLVMSPNESNEHPGVRIKVVDTVGAGDAFTAALVHGYLQKAPLPQINETANRVGAWVASQPGATPSPRAGDLATVLAEIA